MRTNEVIEKLKKQGCSFAKHKKRHDWWYSPITGNYFPIPRHGSKELPNGTKDNIELLSGVKL
jgi:predicted RNA binding protein YcfA (HicA-like mRNA interferase family)